VWLLTHGLWAACVISLVCVAVLSKLRLQMFGMTSRTVLLLWHLRVACRPALHQQLAPSLPPGSDCTRTAKDLGSWLPRQWLPAAATAAAAAAEGSVNPSHVHILNMTGCCFCCLVLLPGCLSICLSCHVMPVRCGCQSWVSG